jgi:hypothetical protein
MPRLTNAKYPQETLLPAIGPYQPWRNCSFAFRALCLFLLSSHSKG